MSQVNLNLQRIYGFNAERPWASREDIAPSTSSVQRGMRRKATRMAKLYVSKKKLGVRRNAPFREIQEMTLACCEKSCITGLSKEEISLQRQALYSQSYESQNYALSNLVTTTTLLSGRTKITYT